MDLTHALAAEEVRGLLARYCDAMDAGDWDGIGALFATGRLSSGGHVLATGAEEVAAFYRKGTQLHDGSPRTKHLVLNTVVDVDPRSGVAEARSSYLVLQAVDGALPLQPIITGRYVDTFSPLAGGYAWDERRFAVDLVGDLSHHLTWNPPT